MSTHRYFLVGVHFGQLKDQSKEISINKMTREKKVKWTSFFCFRSYCHCFDSVHCIWTMVGNGGESFAVLIISLLNCPYFKINHKIWAHNGQTIVCVSIDEQANARSIPLTIYTSLSSSTELIWSVCMRPCPFWPIELLPCRAEHRAHSTHHQLAQRIETQPNYQWTVVIMHK